MNAERLKLLPLASAALALLAAAPAAQAQAVGRYLRPGAGTQQQPSAVQARPGLPAPVQRMPGPVWNRPGLFSPAPFPSAPGFGGNAPVRIYGRESVSGPAVTVPDEGDRYRRRDYPQGGGNNYGNGYGNNYGYGGNYNYGSGYGSGFGDGTNGGTVWTNGAAPPVGPGNGFFNGLTPPVGPGNGFGAVRGRRRDYPVQDGLGGGGTYFYNNYPQGDGGPYGGAPPLLGGYYYGGYSNVAGPSSTYPSVYSVYAGFPSYIYGGGVNVITLGQPYQPVYDTSYLPFAAPSYSVTYNQNNYYVATQGRVQDLEAGGERAREAIRNSWPEASYQAAFGDIARAWTGGDVALLRKHLRDDDTRVSVSINRKYAYSLKSGDYAQITRDALDRLGTVSFTFTRLRKAKNGDVTAYGTHVYRSAQAAAEGGQDGATVPFDQNGPGDGQADGDQAGATEKTVYVSYTLHRRSDQWYIVSVDSSDHSLVPSS